MTLRARFTILVTVLLAVVLGAAFLAYERLDAHEVNAELDRRALELARTGPFGATGWVASAKPGDFAPVDEHHAGGERPKDWRDPEDAFDRLAAQPPAPDGAYVETFLFAGTTPPSASDKPAAPMRFVLRSAASTAVGADAPTAKSLRFLETARSLAGRVPETRRVAIGGREYVVGLNDPKFAGPHPNERPPPPPHGRGGRPPPPPPHHEDFDGHPHPPPEDGGHEDGPPPPPPEGSSDAKGERSSPRKPPRPTPPTWVGVAFLDAGPAIAVHRTRTLAAAGVGAAALLFGALLASALSGRMLRPIRAAAAAAESIHAPSERLPTRGSKDELERLVVVLNGMLARLDEASARERRFLATASHELRRPLTALLGELELASAPGRDAAALRSAISLALGDGRAMRRLVEDLLHHARAQAGALRLDESDVALSDVVAHAVARSRRTLGSGETNGANGHAKTTSLGEVGPAGLPSPARIDVGTLPAVTLRADPDALRQALENLIVNGATHGGPGATVRVSASAVADDGAGLAIHVEDDGPGIPKDELDRIFEPFGRGDRSRTVAGFGLGLTITRDLLVAHGASVDVTSPLRPDEAAHPGTRFTVRWPRSRIRP